ncbi:MULTISPECIES: hypothetical protein [unclassified Nocardia]|uniref:hypothetical protein n=1 Tax=unclassified Nocardia TaxID=2637762 RepID=UPI0033A0875F
MTTIPTRIAADLHRLVESEDLGSSFFAAAADHASSARRRAGWQALHELEIRTQAGVSAFLERADLAIPSTNAMADTLGRIGGSGLHLMPYGLQLRAVRETTTRYLPAFHRLARHYENTAEAAFFDYVVRHELAIIEFTSHALADAPTCIDPVLRLLDHPVPLN